MIAPVCTNSLLYKCPLSSPPAQPFLNLLLLLFSFPLYCCNLFFYWVMVIKVDFHCALCTWLVRLRVWFYGSCFWLPACGMKSGSARNYLVEGILLHIYLCTEVVLLLATQINVSLCLFALVSVFELISSYKVIQFCQLIVFCYFYRNCLSI